MKQHYFEAFQSPTSDDWYLRQVGGNGHTTLISEGLERGKLGILRAAQNNVNGLKIPIVRLNMLDELGVVTESYILRHNVDAQVIDVAAETPLT